MTNVLLAEDDPNLGNLLKEYLEIKSYHVTLARNGEEALQAYKKQSFDILILDVMMPKKDGFSVAREIRKSDEQVPIIFLTAKAQKDDKIEGFEVGADDYLTKPFNMDELLLRIKAILKRAKGGVPAASEEEKVFTIGSFIFNTELQSLGHGKKEVHMTTKEAELLKMLCMHRNGILMRDQALKKIWGDDDYFNARSMDVYITKLRKYLLPDTSIRIMNVHGKGYKLMVLE